MATLFDFDPTRQNRLDSIKHVVYEYGNLMSAYHYSLHGQPPWRTNVDDAFLLGYRKMRDFLLDGYPRFKYDVLALDFLPAGTARTWDLPNWESIWKDQMNQHLAHIAYSRVLSPPPREWNHDEWLPKLRADFLNAWTKFQDAIVEQDYLREFENQMNACKRKKGFDTFPWP